MLAVPRLEYNQFPMPRYESPTASFLGSGETPTPNHVWQKYNNTNMESSH